jgi:diphthamide biosynthesis protein 2
VEVEWSAHGAVQPRALTRHFLHAQRARLAKSIALVAGTMAARGFLPLLRGLRRLIRRSGRRCTTLLIGKLNPAKLANFEGVDVFVVLGAGDASLLPASAQRDFPLPVLAAHELLMGLLPDAVPWQGRLVSDVESLLALLAAVAPDCLVDHESPHAQQRVVVAHGGTAESDGRDGAGADEAEAGDEEEEEEEDDTPFFSPLTGRLHLPEGAAAAAADDQHHVSGAGGALVPAAERALMVQGSAASVLAGKEWQGMSSEVPEGATTTVQRGWHGTARRFDHEPVVGDKPAGEAPE